MRTTLTFAASALLAGQIASASGHDDWEEEFSPPPFVMTTAPTGGVRPAASAPAYLTGSRLVALGDGAAALVVDADSGLLIRTDRGGAKVGELAIGSDAALLAYDDTSRRAYVADRRGDRIVLVHVGDELVVSGAWRTPAEPYGVALMPDRGTLLVTTIADRTLVAFDTTSGRERWRVALGPEPRGIAIAPDGSRAAVASLASGAVEQVALGEVAASARHARKLALPVVLDGQHARGAFAAMFVGDQLVTPYQLHVPVARFPSGDHYGGGVAPPVTHHLAWLAPDGRRGLAQTNVQEPRALAWDAARDTLYVAGFASDQLVAVSRASQVDIGEGEPLALRQRCGADGVAITPGGSVLVWCSFTRSIARFDIDKRGRLGKVQRGRELAPSALDAQRHEGFVLFHSANDHLSSFGALSCGNCHLDARTDGLSWRIEDRTLQTPILAGRLAKETAPFKWDGTAPDLTTSLRRTIRRLGGSGLAKRHVASLVAYLETLPPVRTPARGAAAVARGKRLFDSAELGCASCHEGTLYTDGVRHGLTGGFETPSLLGLAASAPYFHDGSAATLEAVLRDRDKVHGMADAAKALDARSLADLVVFLETL